MKRFIKGQDQKGYQDIFSERYELLDYLAFGKLILDQGESYHTNTDNYEQALVILSGKATIEAEGVRWEKLGGRSTVFEDKATTVYVPCQSSYAVAADTDVVIAICKVKAENKTASFVVRPEDVVVHNRGEKQWNRTVFDILAAQADGKVDRIVLGETINHPGQWSGYPPHKHDGEFAPEEPHLEEIYHYQVNPEQGFGVQHHYTKDGSIDAAYPIRNGDSFAIDIGYHPVGGAGGYEVYYLWFMAGETGRKLYPYEDPDHKWLHNK
ncbi:5-deoxy-glucuronate isomerase [Jeotgalibacillus sp. S-D1]|uniref:5-deoxy-glucuronate isomerase n=1 Tax=Jeotgalibacillus sp. S-D1 TaxID=2552189 RepID=UPI0010598721|nr:5-deoxy-glucuronate isomerase [Jeotgalibacillus sp. S-D1]TDL34252.1 5-deoxy-glucuronate isomerase [Jeotgalibacillus sp. S-D1]